MGVKCSKIRDFWHVKMFHSKMFHFACTKSEI